MKPSNNVCGATTKVPSKRIVKKQINISWNSKIFFQVGLIIALLATFYVMELEIEKPRIVAKAPSGTIWDAPTITYTVDKDIPKLPKEQPKVQKRHKVATPIKPIATHTFIKVANTDPVIEGNVIAEDDPTPRASPIKTGATTAPVTTSIIGVEYVPVFPGCEGAGNNQGKIDCMSAKIRAFISKKFETGKFDYFEPGSIQTIRTFFTINSQGDIVEVKARAKDKKLEEEAKRVISTLPYIQPGRQGDTPVNVTYAVPIHFQVNN